MNCDASRKSHVFFVPSKYLSCTYLHHLYKLYNLYLYDLYWFYWFNLYFIVLFVWFVFVLFCIICICSICIICICSISIICIIYVCTIWFICICFICTIFICIIRITSIICFSCKHCNFCITIHVYTLILYCFALLHYRIRTMCTYMFVSKWGKYISNLANRPYGTVYEASKYCSGHNLAAQYQRCHNPFHLLGAVNHTIDRGFKGNDND